MPDYLLIPIVNAGVILALFVAAWAICVAQRDCTPVDSLWGLGMGAVAISTYVQTGGGTPHRMAMTAICVAWARSAKSQSPSSGPAGCWAGRG